jgi:hypothetical protein
MKMSGRNQKRNWIPVGWIPVYDESRDKRPGKGFYSTSARKIRLYHQCWIEFLDKWAERTKNAVLLPWADGVSRSTRLFIGGVLGDQQEGDKYTGELVCVIAVLRLANVTLKLPTLRQRLCARFVRRLSLPLREGI